MLMKSTTAVNTTKMIFVAAAVDKISWSVCPWNVFLGSLTLHYLSREA